MRFFQENAANLGRVGEIVKICREFEIATTADFVIGFPGENGMKPGTTFDTQNTSKWIMRGFYRKPITGKKRNK